MPLYIRDEDVNKLALELKQILGTGTKTDAVRTALKHEIERQRAKASLTERLGVIQDAIDTLGKTDPNFGLETFTSKLTS